MIYGTKRTDGEILCSGEYEGYRYYIISYGVHPCAYVEVEMSHPWFAKDYYDKVNDNGESPCDIIECHGGLTYAGSFSWIVGHEDGNDRWFFGWDYAHAGDYIGYEQMWGLVSENDKKWTTEEIKREVEFVIHQLKRVECGGYLLDAEPEKEAGKEDETMDCTLAFLQDERILNSLSDHIRVNVSTKAVEIYNEHGVKLVLRDLDEDNFNAFKRRFQNF